MEYVYLSDVPPTGDRLIEYFLKGLFFVPPEGIGQRKEKVEGFCGKNISMYHVPAHGKLIMKRKYYEKGKRIVGVT